MTPAPVAIAEALASRAPDALLPCPGCASSVKGSRLAAHIEKVHGSDLGGPDWRGSDAGSVVLLGVLMLLVGLGGGVGLSAVQAPRVGAALVLALFLPFFVGFLLAIAGKLPARLWVRDGKIECVRLLGLWRNRVAFPCDVEFGTATKERTESVTNHAGRADLPEGSSEVRFGEYLRLRGSAQSLTVACKKGTKIHGHWQAPSLTRGPRRSHWCMTLERSDFVALQYILAAYGMLDVRRDEPQGAKAKPTDSPHAD